MNREKLRAGITAILYESPRPLKAREIREVYCRKNKQATVTVTDINSILYGELRNFAVQDESYRWSIPKPGSSVPNRRREVGRDQALRHIEEARRLSELLGGTDEDVKKYFFGLAPNELNVVLDEYERQHGEKVREYAERAIPSWKSGRRQMSGLVAERLFNLLPPRMPISIKYDMVRTLWEKYCPSSNASFVIGPDCDPIAAEQEISQFLLENVKQYRIPTPLENRFKWLSSGDVTVQQSLLNHFLDEEKRLIQLDSSNRTKIFLRHYEDRGQWTEGIKQEYVIGKHRLELYFDPRAHGINEGRPAPRCSPVAKKTESTGCLVMVVAIIGAGVWAVVLCATIGCGPKGATQTVSATVAAGEPSTSQGHIQARIISVTDGDTIVVRRGNEHITVRLEGIDCPESGQAFGGKAKHATSELALGKDVAIQVTGSDRYGRTLGKVLLPDGKELNQVLVDRGYAWWFRKYSKDHTLENFESDARLAKRGLWVDENPVAPWDWRAANRQRSDRPVSEIEIIPSEVKIVGLLPNPNGEDAGNEQVMLQNSSANVVDLEGWRLLDKGGHVYLLLGKITSKEVLSITMKEPTMPLNNDGDEVVLVDAQGIGRHRVSYVKAQARSGSVVRFDQ